VSTRDGEEVTADLMTRARAGDHDAFRELTEPHRRELHVHCYRMLGSFQDAEDALQDTLLAAWRGLGGFEQRASIRTWLYRIATNRCLNAVSEQGRQYDLAPTRANGQLAFGVYLRSPTGGRGFALDVITLTGDRVSTITRFDASVLRSFGLPPWLHG
jgi:hypothetical protein